MLCIVTLSQIIYDAGQLHHVYKIGQQIDNLVTNISILVKSDWFNCSTISCCHVRVFQGDRLISIKHTVPKKENERKRDGGCNWRTIADDNDSKLY